MTRVPIKNRSYSLALIPLEVITTAKTIVINRTGERLLVKQGLTNYRVVKLRMSVIGMSQRCIITLEFE